MKIINYPAYKQVDINDPKVVEAVKTTRQKVCPAASPQRLSGGNTNPEVIRTS